VAPWTVAKRYGLSAVSALRDRSDQVAAKETARALFFPFPPRVAPLPSESAASPLWRARKELEPSGLAVANTEEGAWRDPLVRGRDANSWALSTQHVLEIGTPVFGAVAFFFLFLPFLHRGVQSLSALSSRSHPIHPRDTSIDRRDGSDTAGNASISSPMGGWARNGAQRAVPWDARARATTFTPICNKPGRSTPHTPQPAGDRMPSNPAAMWRRGVSVRGTVHGFVSSHSLAQALRLSLSLARSLALFPNRFFRATLHSSSSAAAAAESTELARFHPMGLFVCHRIACMLACFAHSCLQLICSVQWASRGGGRQDRQPTGFWSEPSNPQSSRESQLQHADNMRRSAASGILALDSLTLLISPTSGGY